MNLFVLISSYFMVNSKITANKIIKILSKVWLYSVVSLIACKMANYNIDIKTIIKSLLPVTYSNYWFVTTYIILMLCSPFINKLIGHMNQKEYIRLLLLLLVIWYFIPTFTNGDLTFSNLGWFVTLYLIGGYIRNYINQDNLKSRWIPIISVISITLLLLSIVVLNYLGNRYNIQSLLLNSRYFCNMNSFLIVIMSISIFLISLRRTWNNKFINGVAKTTFGVYLIHENMLIRPIIWNDIFRVNSMVSMHATELVLNGTIVISCVYICCTLIDILMRSNLRKVVFNSNK